MAEIITMPRLSDTMTEGKVAKWHKKVGDAVKEGDILAEIETDKAVQDFESEFDGVLLKQGVAEGESAPVDSVLAVIGQAGEEVPATAASDSKKEESPESPEKKTDEEHKTEDEQTSVEEADAEIPVGVEMISMPRLSDTMTEGKVAKWLKNVGDTVKEGDLLAEIETDKAVQDFESEFNGVLLKQGVAEGESVPVDSLLAIIGPANTDVSKVGSAKSPSAKTAEPSKETKPADKQTAPADSEISVPQGSSAGRIHISPLAKKMAAERGIDFAQIQGTGENGRIVKQDIEQYQPKAPETAKPAAATVPIMPMAAFGEDSETPNSQVRTVIAKRLSESKFSAPHYYLMIEVMMDKAIAARKEMNELPDTKISYNDMVIKAAAMALRKHPQVNSTWAGDKIIHHGAINIGVAVAVPDGLLVPVLKNADAMAYSAISAQVKDMAGRAKTRELKANEMENSTFSISNLGMFGIETFTSIINLPNSAIMSVGAIIEKPVVKDGQIVVGNTMKVSLACDHRVIDGATGAEFLQTFKQYLEQPLTMLV